MNEKVVIIIASKIKLWLDDSINVGKVIGNFRFLRMAFEIRMENEADGYKYNLRNIRYKIRKEQEKNDWRE